MVSTDPRWFISTEATYCATEIGSEHRGTCAHPVLDQRRSTVVVIADGKSIGLLTLSIGSVS